MCLRLLAMCIPKLLQTVMDDDFNLGVLTMRTPEGVFETDFDIIIEIQNIETGDMKHEFN